MEAGGRMIKVIFILKTLRKQLLLNNSLEGVVYVIHFKSIQSVSK